MANEFATVIRSIYSPWIDTAVCREVRFFRHQITEQILCDSCRAELHEQDQNASVYYDRISRHYIHIGPAERYARCWACDREITPYNRAVVCCTSCDRVLTKYLYLLYNSDDTPHLDSEATVITLREFIRCAIREE